MRLALTFDDVSLVPAYRHQSTPTAKIDISVQMGPYKLDLPIMSSNMDTITGHVMANKMRELGGIGVLHRFMSIEDNVDEFIATIRDDAASKSCIVSVGIRNGLERAASLYAAGARIFCVDVAHGHSKLVGMTIKRIRVECPDAYIIAGNVATYEGADYLVGCGADAIKVGIGPGSVCATRLNTGFGLPQITAIQECSRSDAFIIADGGIRYPGDAVKALAAGADCIMLGGLLAGTDETPGSIDQATETIFPEGLENLSIKPFVEKIGPKFKVFRGMASKEAREDYFGQQPGWSVAEGVSIKVPCKGPVADVINDIAAGIQNGLGYCGARTVRDLKRKIELVQITPHGFQEGTAHHGM